MHSELRWTAVLKTTLGRFQLGILLPFVSPRRDSTKMETRFSLVMMLPYYWTMFWCRNFLPNYDRVLPRSHTVNRYLHIRETGFHVGREVHITKGCTGVNPTAIVLWSWVKLARAKEERIFLWQFCGNCPHKMPQIATKAGQR